MVDLSKKHVRIVDNGLYVSFARHIAKSFGKADYYIPWQSYCPRSTDLFAGQGFDELRRVKFVLDDADDVDLWVFLDVYHADLQCYLEDHGARVWGGRRGEEMELYRWEFKKYLRSINLPVQPVEHIVGLDKLREFLRHKKDKFIKTSFVRGDFETFRHESYALSEPKLDELGHVLGPLKDGYEFVVEDDIPNAIEVGYDGFTVDGQFPNHAMMAYEVKDVGMLGATKLYTDLAKPVKTVNSALVPALKGYKYRGFVCTEIRMGVDRKPYLIDPCCRLGTPSNELLQELFDGWAETLWHGAEGELVSPKPVAKFGALAVIHSEWAVNNWQSLYYPKELDPWVKLRFHARVDGVNYTVPQPIGLPAPGVVVGVGDTLLDAISECKAHAHEVKGHQISIELDSFDDALESIVNGEKLGVHFADRLPTVEQLKKA